MPAGTFGRVGSGRVPPSDFSGTGYQTLDFRISRQESPADSSQPHSLNSSVSTNFSIQLVMADGSFSSPVRLSTYADLSGPVGGKNQLQP